MHKKKTAFHDHWTKVPPHQCPKNKKKKKKKKVEKEKEGRNTIEEAKERETGLHFIVTSPPHSLSHPHITTTHTHTPTSPLTSHDHPHPLNCRKQTRTRSWVRVNVAEFCPFFFVFDDFAFQHYIGFCFLKEGVCNKKPENTHTHTHTHTHLKEFICCQLFMIIFNYLGATFTFFFWRGCERGGVCVCVCVCVWANGSVWQRPVRSFSPPTPKKKHLIKPRYVCCLFVRCCVRVCGWMGVPVVGVPVCQCVGGRDVRRRRKYHFSSPVSV